MMLKPSFALLAWCCLVAASAAQFDAVCVVEVHVGRVMYGGSGTLIGPKHVITCGHVVEGRPSSVTVRFRGGETAAARVKFHSASCELTLLELARSPSVKPAPIRARPLARGEQVWVAGFDESKLDRFRHGRAQYVGQFRAGAPQDQYGRIVGERLAIQTSEFIGFGSVSGNSGGGVFDAQGSLVGTIWGGVRQADRRSTQAISSVYITQFCQNGRCQQPQQPQQRVIYDRAPPRVRMMPVQGIPAHTHGDMTKRLDKIAAAVQAIQNAPRPDLAKIQADLDALKRIGSAPPIPGPAGPQGPQGPPGPPGMDAGVDFNAIATSVANALEPRFQSIESRLVTLENQGPVTPPPARSHYAVIVDQSADYWPQLEPLYTKASQRYAGMRLVNPTAVNYSGPMPVIVRYQSGSPVKDDTAYGYRDVRAVLYDLSKG